MYIHFFNSTLMRPPHFYERGYAYAYLRMTMTQEQLNHAATYQFHHEYLTKISKERFSKLFVKEQK